MSQDWAKLIATMACVLCLCFTAGAQVQVTGQWGPMQTFPYVPVHVTLLPSGNMLWWGYYADSLNPQIWGPGNNAVTPAVMPSIEIFCSGHLPMADGRVFITGGHIDDFVGYPNAQIYDPVANTLTQVPDMNNGRWYPTNTVLANGNILVVSGDMTASTGADPQPEIYDVATNSWIELTTAQMVQPTYPVMLLAPNGQVFNAGPGPTTAFLTTTGTGAWTAGPTMEFSSTRDYGPGLMYNIGQVMEVGGSDPPTNTAEVINLTSSTPAWTYTGAMNYARRQHNAVLMPDGKVFAVGGSNASGFDTESGAVFPTEMWNPSTGAWSVMDSIAVYRGYHSTAILLPNGQVFSGGGNAAGATYQVFSPPYMFASYRPSITAAPAAVKWAETALIGTPDAASITQVSVIRLPSTTHTFDQSQRFIPLTFTTAKGGLDVTFPANGDIAPPGYYMLFLVNSSDVPSVAAMVLINGTAPTTGTITGTVNNTSGSALAGVTVTGGGVTATTLSTGSYTLENVTAGTVAISAALTGYGSSTGNVTVKAGKIANAATLELPPASPGTISGKVVNSAGAGVAGATVTACGKSATTGSTGSYSLTKIPAGSVTVTASDTAYNSASETVTVTSGKTVSAPAITLTAGPGTISGYVTDTSSNPLSGVTVSYAGGSTVSGYSGLYVLTNVPSGAVQLTTSFFGYTPLTQTVSVTAGAEVTQNLAIVPSGIVAGQVTDATTGAAIAAATVAYSGGSTVTDSNGNYGFNYVPAGSPSFTASATGYVANTLSVTVTSGNSSTLNIPLTEQ